MVTWKIPFWTSLLGVRLVRGGGIFSSTCNAVKLTSKGFLTADCAAINGTRFDSQLDLGLCYANLQDELGPVKRYALHMHAG